MTAERVTGTVVVAGQATTALSPTEILSERSDVRVRTVERTAVTEWAESLRPSAQECVVLTARRADGPWLETVAVLRATAPTVPVVLVTNGQVERLASAAAREGVDAYLNLAAETPSSLVETIEAVVARHRRPDRDAGAHEPSGLADGAADPMYLLDDDGRVRQCNDALCSLLETSRAALVDRHVRTFVPAEDSDRLRALVDDLDDGSGRSGTLDAHIETPDGDRMSCELSVAPVADGAERGAVVVARDLTERERREARLVRQNERLEEFATVVSHDLRNPLNVAIGRLELLLEEYDSDHLTAIDGAHRRIESIIDNLLAMARTGSSAESHQPVSLAVVARAAWDLVETGDATLAADVDCTVEANAGRLQQLFENLFRNSVEHGATTPDSRARRDAVDHTDGAPAVRVGPIQTATRDDAGVEPTGFYVADDGPGIPPAARADVFDYGTTGPDGGTGFGLAIVRDIALEHDWQIHVTNSERGGACFEVSGVSMVATRE